MGKCPFGLCPNVSDWTNGGAGNDTYVLKRAYGASTITDSDSTTGNTDILSLGSGIARDQLWFAQSGSDLVASVIGANAKMTIKNWYTSANNQIEKFTTADDYVLNPTGVQKLVQAMASYANAHAGFDPTAVAAAPSDPTLQGQIAASWHA